jgi:hypothetical protein
VRHVQVRAEDLAGSVRPEHRPPAVRGRPQPRRPRGPAARLPGREAPQARGGRGEPFGLGAHGAVAHAPVGHRAGAVMGEELAPARVLGPQQADLVRPGAQGRGEHFEAIEERLRGRRPVGAGPQAGVAGGAKELFAVRHQLRAAVALVLGLVHGPVHPGRHEVTQLHRHAVPAQLRDRVDGAQVGLLSQAVPGWHGGVEAVEPVGQHGLDVRGPALVESGDAKPDMRAELPVPDEEPAPRRRGRVRVEARVPHGRRDNVGHYAVEHLRPRRCHVQVPAAPFWRARPHGRRPSAAELGLPTGSGKSTAKEVVGGLMVFLFMAGTVSRPPGSGCHLLAHPGM